MGPENSIYALIGWVHYFSVNQNEQKHMEFEAEMDEKKQNSPMHIQNQIV